MAKNDKGFTLTKADLKKFKGAKTTKAVSEAMVKANSDANSIARYRQKKKA